MPKGKKSKFADLPTEFKTKFATAKQEEINLELAEVTKAKMRLKDAMEEDTELQDCREALKCAMHQYREPMKELTLKVKFLCQVLKDRGQQ